MKFSAITVLKNENFVFTMLNLHLLVKLIFAQYLPYSLRRLLEARIFLISAHLLNTKGVCCGHGEEEQAEKGGWTKINDPGYFHLRSGRPTVEM